MKGFQRKPRAWGEDEWELIEAARLGGGGTHESSSLVLHHRAPNFPLPADPFAPSPQQRWVLVAELLEERAGAG